MGRHIDQDSYDAVLAAARGDGADVRELARKLRIADRTIFRYLRRIEASEAPRVLARFGAPGNVRYRLISAG